MKTNASIKKTALILAVLVLSSLTAISNTTPVNKKASVNETEKTIKDYFKFPGVLIPLVEIQKPETQKVEVLFTTGQDGKVNFALAKTTQPDLKREIENQFLKLRLVKIKPNMVNSVVLNFKTL